MDYYQFYENKTEFEHQGLSGAEYKATAYGAKRIIQGSKKKSSKKKSSKPGSDGVCAFLYYNLRTKRTNKFWLNKGIHWDLSDVFKFGNFKEELN